MNSGLKRIGIDIGGYGLILLGIATGWLPGPGGVPLILAGLALLSLNNEWARRLRDWLLRNGGEFLTYLFPKNKTVQIMYDLLAVVILIIVAFLVANRAAVWQIGLASGLFLFVLTIVGMNRDRLGRLKRHYNRGSQHGS
jgi:hypothetical protein